jgi:hypothetical protein
MWGDFEAGEGREEGTVSEVGIIGLQTRVYNSVRRVLVPKDGTLNVTLGIDKTNPKMVVTSRFSIEREI